MDKEGANPERVKQELSEAGLLPEEWGGKTPMMQVWQVCAVWLVDCLPMWQQQWGSGCLKYREAAIPDAGR